MAKKSNKRGYGAHNVARKKITQRHLTKIIRKDWKSVSSMELYTLFNEGWKTEKLSSNYNVSVFEILNRLRFL